MGGGLSFKKKNKAEKRSLTSLAQEKQRKTLARFPDFPYLCTVNI